MARLVYITIGLSGGLNSSLELARRVAEQGHDVSFVGHRDVGQQINAHGFDYVQLTDDERAIAALRTRIDAVGHLRALPFARRLRAEVAASNEIEHAVRQLKPDALIVDIEAHYALIATRSLEIPTLTKSDFFSMRHQRGVPPLHSTQPMPRTVPERFAAEMEWAKARAKRIATNTIGELHPRRLARRSAPFRYNTVARQDLRRVAKARGHKLGEISSRRGWLWPHTYPTLPLVSATPQELDFVAETWPNDHWVGPLVPSTRPESSLTASQNERWQAFQATNAASTRPLLYCSFGTILPDTSAMLRCILDAARNRPDWDLVIGLGARGQQAFASGEVGDNVLVLDFAPQIEVLQSADLAIIHGGINGILEALVNGVPMIVERRGPGDGPGNAARVAHAGAARSIDLADTTPGELVDLIDHMLKDQTLRDQVDQLREQVGRYRQDRVVETIVERLLNGSL